MLMPPPGYSRDEFRAMAHHVEEFLRPWWEVGPRQGDSEAVLAEKKQKLAQMQQQWRQQVDQYVIPAMQQQVDEAYAAVAAGHMTKEAADKATERTRTILAELKVAAPPPPIENFFFV